MAQESSDLTQREYDELTEGRGDEFMAAAPTEGVDVDTGNDETQHLKAQIEETRSQMGETIDALQEKLSFSNTFGSVVVGNDTPSFGAHVRSDT